MKTGHSWHFTHAAASGTPPAPRASHAAAVIDGNLIVLGGWNGNTAYDDAHALELATLEWHEFAVTREEHASLGDRSMFGYAEHGGRIYVHGGWNTSDAAAVCDGLFSFAPAIGPVVLQGGDRWRGTLATVATEGNGPGAVARHAMASLGDSLYVFGGWGGLGSRDAPYAQREPNPSLLIRRLTFHNRCRSSGWGHDTFRLDLAASPLPRWERLEVEGFTPWRRS